MNKIRYTVRGIEIPNYIIDILMRGRCDVFLDMRIVHEKSTYVFTCDSLNYEEFDPTKASYEDKIKTLSRLFEINNVAENRLIGAENYHINSEVLRKRNGLDPLDGLKLLFYPDAGRRNFASKMISLIDSMIESTEEREKDMFEQVKKDIANGDMHRAKSRLERALLRVEQVA